MSSLSLPETRAELAADLEAAGFSTTEQLVATIDPPVVVIACDEPYLVDDGSFSDELVMNLALFVVYDPELDQSLSSAADRAVQDVVLAVDDRWSLTDISAPFKASNLGGRPCCRLRYSTTVRLTEGTPPL